MSYSICRADDGRAVPARATSASQHPNCCFSADKHNVSGKCQAVGWGARSVLAALGLLVPGKTTACPTHYYVLVSINSRDSATLRHRLSTVLKTFGSLEAVAALRAHMAVHENEVGDLRQPVLGPLPPLPADVMSMLPEPLPETLSHLAPLVLPARPLDDDDDEETESDTDDEPPGVWLLERVAANADEWIREERAVFSDAVLTSLRTCLDDAAARAECWIRETNASIAALDATHHERAALEVQLARAVVALERHATKGRQAVSSALCKKRCLEEVTGPPSKYHAAIVIEDRP